MPEQPHVSMETVAKRAGVNRSTVSLSLRNDPRLPAETRDRIQSIARELGYRPNPAVSTLMSGIRRRRYVRDRETIALVFQIPARLAAEQRTRVSDGYLSGATERADQLGFQLEQFWGKDENLSARRLSDILQTRNIRGVLLWPVEAARGHISLDLSKFAVATLGYSVWKPDMHRAAVNHYQGVMLALRTLRRRGYRRIGLAINAKTDERVNHQNTAAFYVFREQLPRRDRVDPFIARQFDQKHFTRWFEKQQPDAVLGNASTILSWLRQCRKRTPEDVGFVHLQWEEGPATCAGIRQNAKDVGAAGMGLIVAQLYENETGLPTRPKLVLIQGDWIEGGTVRPRLI
ncbi:MAG: LacI family DNA-binding transcriptional regulator [Verrucomicrobia bacterium]|nr:LacI family DNA-binding transcriptional regulator [Verrucomicrobiota bacterium]